MEKRNNEINVCLTVPPCSSLIEELKERKITQKTFALRIGLQPTHFNEMIKVKRRITPEIALRIEKELGIDASIWLNLQAKYDCDILRLKHTEKKDTSHQGDDDSLFKVLLKKKGLSYADFLVLVKKNLLPKI